MQLNPGNLCGDLDIVHVATDNPYRFMYEKQLNLQQRLGTCANAITLQDKVKQVIYWGHCVSEEFVELIGWLPARSETTMKELRMEYIDMLHFGLNIAVTLNFSIETVEIGLAKNGWYVQNTKDGLDVFDLIKQELNMRKRFCELVGLLPWKTWKQYKDVDFSDLPKLENAYFNYMRAMFAIAGSLGMSLEDVTNMYASKNKENHARQDRGY